MPRFAITIATLHGDKAPSKILAGPDVSIDAQKAALKKLASSREHNDFSELALLESDAGITRIHRFRKPMPTEKPKQPKAEPKSEPKLEEKKSTAKK